MSQEQPATTAHVMALTREISHLILRIGRKMNEYPKGSPHRTALSDHLAELVEISKSLKGATVSTATLASATKRLNRRKRELQGYEIS